MNQLQKAMHDFTHVFYTPGKGGHIHGFDVALVAGNKHIGTLQEIENTFSGKNEISAAGLFRYEDRLKKQNKDAFIGFPEIDFFSVDKIFSGIDHNAFPEKQVHGKQIIPVALVSRGDYLQTVNEIKKHIQRGDIYEVNYCIEFRAENVELDAVAFFEQLYALTRAPFSCIYKSNNKYVFSASPERFLQRTGKQIISQPIKGTIRKGNTEEENNALKNELLNTAKERSENVMIVDLVRNDLSRIASRGSVKVDELFGIYSFETVNQMISTVSCQVAEGITLQDIFLATFPMGSMTGAPKISAMQIINRYEAMARGAYSGSLGYFNANGNFDLNVVIRSMVYDAGSKRLSFSVGSAITHYCEPEKEYEECLLKASALMRSLER